MNFKNLKTRSNCAFRLIYHLVLVTKFRNDSLTGEMLERLEDLFRSTLAKWDCELIEFGGESSHPRLVRSYPQY
jgi:putative transposase